MARDYIGGVAGHLHDFKKSYQPNMLLSLSVTTVLFVAAGGFISILGRGSSSDNDRALRKTLSLPIIEALQAGTGSSGRGNFAAVQSGFAGFQRYAVGNTASDPRIRRPRVSDLIPGDIDCPDIVPAASTPLGSGAEIDYGLPAPATFMDILPSSNWLNRLPQVGVTTPGLRYTEPLIRFAHVRYPEKGWYVNGIVTVAFVIAENGAVQDYMITREQPTGHGFARALKDAINESMFFAGELNGEKVAVRIKLTYEFCWDCKEPRGIQISQGVIVKRAM